MYLSIYSLLFVAKLKVPKYCKIILNLDYVHFNFTHIINFNEIKTLFFMKNTKSQLKEIDTIECKVEKKKRRKSLKVMWTGQTRA